MDYFYNDQKETREAIRAGEAALNALRSAKNELNSAKNWGIYDILGGGMLSTLIKHNKMGNAESCIREAQYKLDAFHKELNDVRSDIGADLSTGDFLSFADWFFDGFIADVMVQNRINRVRDEVDRTIREVEEVLRRLRSRL